MFDIAWSELLVIAVLALVVIGPKDLPKAIYQLGKWVRKARVVAREFQTHIDDMMRETELEELRKEALKTRDLNIKKMMEDTIDPKGEVGKAFDVGLNGHAGSPPEGDAPQVPAPAAPAASVPPAATPPASAPPQVVDSVAPAAAPSPITPAPAPAPAHVPADMAPHPVSPQPVPEPVPATGHTTDKQTQ
ncbi:Sec-independent protein translocase protein TatB [Azospirillum picis]|uniref:Sec-independent protein translocase protein TatB n=1 Tax=Azospirillum picis TaxID=488438 RepID=A0ABU0MTW2_9PROT|nr:Sec-independent protein translocase protein TatB [Azospirillum picis]MBP2303182.1 sec-independent protein translocase protein TatB [Azospirillum picis]MDQ0536934.1 sec-independent protein translocase protein TatB [Azospirillum picis]